MKKTTFIGGAILFLWLLLPGITFAEFDADLKQLLFKFTTSVVDPGMSSAEFGPSLENQFPLNTNSTLGTRQPQANTLTYFPLNSNDNKSYSGRILGQTYHATYTYMTTYFSNRSCYREQDSLDGSQTYYGMSGNTLMIYGAKVGNETFALNSPLPVLNESMVTSGGVLRSSSSLTLMGYNLTLNMTVTARLAGAVTVPMGTMDNCLEIEMAFLFTMAGESETLDLKDVWILAPNVGKLKIAVMDQLMIRRGWLELNGGSVGGKSVSTFFSQPPDSAFSGTPLTGFSPLTVNFSDQSAGSVNTWLWNFGDGTTSTEKSPVHTYSAPGQYTVQLQVVGAGQSDTETKVKYITVAHPKPVSGFSADTILGLPSKSLQFKNESSGTITGQVWNFGDGQDSTLLSPTHGYTTPGIYTVSLTTTGPGGSDSLTRNNYIRIAPVWVDINGDAKFGLKDIFPVLKILAGDSTLDENLIFNDINGDAKTGMAEGAYLLQILSHDGIE